MTESCKIFPLDSHGLQCSTCKRKSVEYHPQHLLSLFPQPQGLSYCVQIENPVNAWVLLKITGGYDLALNSIKGSGQVSETHIKRMIRSEVPSKGSISHRSQSHSKDALCFAFQILT